MGEVRKRQISAAIKLIVGGMSATLLAGPVFAKDSKDLKDSRDASKELKDTSVKPGDSAYGFYYDAKTNRYFSDGKSSFSIRPIEDKRYLDHIEVSVDGGEFELYTNKLHFEKEGLHQIRFRAADPLMNWSPLQDYRVYVDLIPPKSFSSWQGPSYETEKSIYTSPQSQLSIIAQDGYSGVARITWEESGVSKAYSAPLKFTSEGEHVIRFSAIDNVGNLETTNELKFIVDAKPPTTKAEIAGASFKVNGGLYVNSGNQIVLTAIDEGSGIKQTEYQINGGPITIYKSPIAITEKKTEIRCRSIDRVDNTEQWRSLTVFQDTNPPQIALEKQGTHIVSGGKIYASPGFAIEVKAKDDETGLKEFTVSTDGKTFQKVSQNKFPFNQPGEYHFVFRATDQVGNTSESDPYTIVVDNKPPKSELRASDKLLAPKEGDTWLASVPNKLEIVSHDEGAGVERIEYSYDGKTFLPYAQPLDLAQWNTPKRTVYYRAIDRLGNREATQSMNIYLKTEGPKVDLFVESEKYPDVPLSTLQKMRKPAAAASVGSGGGNSQ